MKSNTVAIDVETQPREAGVGVAVRGTVKKIAKTEYLILATNEKAK
jgi:hypothetical protein